MNQLSQDAMTNDLNTTAEDVSADTAEEAQATATPKDDGKSAAQPTDAEKAARALQRRVDRLTAERHQDREELARLRNQKPAEKRAEEGEEVKQLTEEDVHQRLLSQAGVRRMTRCPADGIRAQLDT